MDGKPTKISATFLGVSDKFITGIKYDITVTNYGINFLVHLDKPGNLIPYVEETYTAREYFINWAIHPKP